MNYSKYRFTLDMHRCVSQISIPVMQYDTGINLYISLADGGRPYVINDGCIAVFYAKKADGEPLMNSCAIENNTVIRYELTEQTTAFEGIVDCEMRLYNAKGHLLTSPKFILVVHSRVVQDDDFPLSDSERSILDQMVVNEAKREEALAKALEDFNSIKLTWLGEYWARPYAVNEAVYYNGSSYICIKTHEEGHAPTDTEYWNLIASGGIPYELTEADKGEIAATVLDSLPVAEEVSV